jgi:hypothetical protein
VGERIGIENKDGMIQIPRAIAQKVFAQHGMRVEFWEEEWLDIQRYLLEFSSDQHSSEGYWIDSIVCDRAPWRDRHLFRFLEWLANRRWKPRLKVIRAAAFLRFKLKLSWTELRFSFPDWMQHCLVAKVKVTESRFERFSDKVMDTIESQLRCVRSDPVVILLGTGAYREGMVDEMIRTEYVGWGTPSFQRGMTHRGIPMKRCQFLAEDAVVVVVKEDVNRHGQYNR